MLVHSRVTPSIKFAGTHLYTWVEIGTLEKSFLPKNTTQCPALGLKPGFLNLERVHLETMYEATTPPKCRL